MRYEVHLVARRRSSVACSGAGQSPSSGWAPDAVIFLLVQALRLGYIFPTWCHIRKSHTFGPGPHPAEPCTAPSLARQDTHWLDIDTTVLTREQAS